MRPILAIAAVLVLSSNAVAGPLDVSAPASVQTLAALSPLNVQKVYPPLPTLAMLPVSAGEEEDATPPRTTTKKGRKTRRVAAVSAPSLPEPRLVVSDETRSYLKDVDLRLDAALAR
jgi:hypothetical protein